MEEYSYNVWVFNPNKKEFEPYDVMPYLVSKYMETKKDKRPKTIDDLNTFVEQELRYMFWSRCEWEIVLKDWPVGKTERKIDVYEQCMLNKHNLIAEFAANLMENHNIIFNLD